MKASVYKEYGASDVLKLEKVTKPTPKNNEVLIKVYATTVNRTDCAMLTAKPFIMRFSTGLFKPKKTILGTDFAGRIEAVGENVESFKVGDRVFGFNDEGLSSHAEYMTIRQDMALSYIPDKVSYKEAAASIEGAHYAYNIINKVKYLGHQRALVNGATGAIGSATVQLLKFYGSHVTAVCEGHNAELVKSLGADKIIDYNTEDFTKTGQKYNYVFDTVGKSSFGKCKRILEPDGTYISSELGKGSQNVFLALFTPIFSKKQVKFPFPFNKLRSVLLVKKLMEEGVFKPLIDREYPLDQIADAFTYVKSGKKTGNVVITMTD